MPTPTYEEIRDQIDTAIPDTAPGESQMIEASDINDAMNMIVDKLEDVEANAGGSGSSGVSSFNTRTGAVTPASGDYTGAQITQDSTHRFVTDAEKATWNAGTGGSGSDPDWPDLSGTTWDGTSASKVLSANTALTLTTTLSNGAIFIKQDGTGSRTLSINGNSIDINTAADSVTAVSFSITDFGTVYLSDKSAVLASGVNLAPVASSVSISGTAQQGQTLTGSYTYSDAESDPQGTSLKQWYRANDGSGTGRAAISGATNTSYVLQAGDVGKFIQYGVTPVATSGTTPGTEGVSAYTSAVAALGNDAPVASSVAFTGTETEGATLTGTYTYSDTESDVQGASVKKWYRSNDAIGTGRAAISGATNATYVLQTADVGKFIQYAVTPVAVTGTSPGTEVFSAFSGAIAAAGGGSFPFSEDFEAASVPALPSTFLGTGTMFETAATAVTGSTKALRFAQDGTTHLGNAMCQAGVAPLACTITVDIYHATGANVGVAGIIQRANSATPASVTSGYLASFTQGGGVRLYDLSGYAVIASSLIASPSHGLLQMTYEIDASHNHTVTMFDPGTGLYFGPGGSGWVAGPVAAITVNDTTYSSAGRCGIQAQLTSPAVDDLFFDNFNAS